MAHEIERKFLVVGDGWQRGSRRSLSIRQAYLARPDATVVRVRIVDEREGFITIKSAPPGFIRSEFEYVIPVADALQLLRFRTGCVIKKRRHIVPAGGFNWEVDVFDGDHQGLVIAEVELADPDARLELPDWVGREVTGDPQYYNSNLAHRRFAANALSLAEPETGMRAA